MGTFEIILIIGAILTPVVAMLIIIPKKIKKKEEKTIETKPYVVAEKEEVKQVTEVPKEEPINLVKPNQINDDLQTYREYLNKKQTSQPKKLELNGKFDNLTEDYRAFMERMNKKPEKNKYDVSELSDEMKALLILGILDRKE